MPWAPPKPCAHPGCRQLVLKARYCEAHRKQRQREETARREPGSRAFYKTAAWRDCRAKFIAGNPACSVEGCGSATTEVDHIIEISRGGAKFDWRNLRGYCKPCHSRKTARSPGAFGRRG